ncbi:MAG: hypothetical protein NC399_02045 [Muribaculum sp.]|nr:hypothetical protein [Muribaculum sp.]
MKKKFVSLMLAGVLAAGMPLTAFAATPAEAPSDVTISTEGTINYLNTTVYSVTLPTAGCFNFTIDPQGILSATDKTTYTEEKYPNGTAGYIVATEESGAYIKNESSVPIKLTVDAYVAKDEAGAASSINLLSLDEYGAGLTNSGIDNNMMLSLDITDELEDGKMLADETGIKTETVVPNVLAIEKNGAPAADSEEKATQISFALNKASYKFDGTVGNYTYVPDDAADALPGDAVGMRLSGFVNTNADWSAYAGDSAEKIIVKTVFAFDKLSSDYEVAALDGRAHGVLADVDAAYFAGMTYDEANDVFTDEPAAGTMEYEVGKGALEIPFDLGAGTKELTVKGVDVGGATLAEADYKVMNGLITVKSTQEDVAAIMAGATVDGTDVVVTITTSNDKATVVTVKMYGTVVPTP